jgi:type IV pilus assembly protein PilB
VIQNEEYVLEILQDAGMITRSQAEAARQSAPGDAVDKLVEQGLLTQEDIAQTLAAQSGLEYVNIADKAIPTAVIHLLEADTARRYRAIPIQEREDALIIAVADPMDIDSFDALNHLLKRQIEFVCATPEQIKKALDRYYGDSETAATSLLKQLEDEVLVTGESGGDQDDDEGGPTGDAPVIKMVTLLLVEAYKNRASDIHIEPLEKKLRVRFRIDGVLQEMQSPPRKLHAAMISRLKIMTGSMSIAERRLPQDGRIQVKLGNKSIDLRVSIIPTVHGESVVMRILDKSSLMLGLPELGFLSDDQAKFEQLMGMPDGIILVTGPTGSGKTTTLYACLNALNKPDRKLITVEDPVEYQMTGINQVQVKTEIGMTFPAALRSILRQAPNIIMIGEIRDAETANIAINASLTGHLVLSTLHTNDATSAVARLVDIGVKPFLVASSLRAVMAQRLVRKLCNECKEPTELSEYEMKSLFLDKGMMAAATPMRAVGCATCRGKGYKGRMGIFEVFMVDNEVQNLVINGATSIQLRNRARELGMRTLREDGVRKVLAGMVTAEEVISVTMSDAN